MVKDIISGVGGGFARVGCDGPAADGGDGAFAEPGGGMPIDVVNGAFDETVGVALVAIVGVGEEGVLQGSFRFRVPRGLVCRSTDLVTSEPAPVVPLSGSTSRDRARLLA